MLPLLSEWLHFNQRAPRRRTLGAFPQRMALGLAAEAKKTGRAMNSLGLFFEKSSRMSGRARHRQPARSALSEVLLVAAGDFLRAAFGLVRLVGSRASLRRLLHDVLLRRALLRLGSSGTFRCHFAISLGCRIGRLPNQGWFTSAPQKKQNSPCPRFLRAPGSKTPRFQLPP